MSKVMQALESSEQRHHASTQPMQTHMYHQGKASGTQSLFKPVIIALSLPLIAGSIATYQSYITHKQAWIESNVAQTKTVEVPFDYTVVEEPLNATLKSTYRPSYSIEQNASLTSTEQASDNVEVTGVRVTQNEIPTAAIPESDTAIKQEKQADQDVELFDKLDLSELSPELALRVESAWNTSQVEPEQKVTAIKLSHQPDAWYGRLPAMNFQTHVYSSRPTKRWVKINGVEYGEGDWIGEVELVAIEQQSCLIRYQGELIEVPALYDWQG